MADPLGDRAQVGHAAEHDHQLVGVHADQHLGAHRGRPAHRGVQVVDVGGGVADEHQHRCRGGPAQRRGPAGQLVGALAAHEGVDDQGLEPGVPGAAVLRVAGVDVRGREGDLAAVLQHGQPQHVGLAGLGDLGDPVLHDLDGDLDQVDGLPQRDGAHQFAGCRAEDLAAQPRGAPRVPAPLDQRGDAGLRHEHHPRALVGRHGAEPGQRVVHAGHGLGGQRARGPLEPAQRRLRRSGCAHRCSLSWGTLCR